MSDYISFTRLGEAVALVARRRDIEGLAAWEMLRSDIAAGNIKARCLARRYDAGESRYVDRSEVLDPSWLTFLAYAEPDRDHLRFDTADAARAIIKGLASHSPPEHAREVELDGQRLNALHPRPREAPPGPKPALRQGISNKMFDELVTEAITSPDLRGMKLEALAARYGGSKGTARVARQDALKRFSEIGNSEQL